MEAGIEELSAPESNHHLVKSYLYTLFLEVARYCSVKLEKNDPPNTGGGIGSPKQAFPALRLFWITLKKTI